MKIYTQEEFDAIERDEYGVKHCPTGDYTQIKTFGEWCRFGEWCSFGNGCSFGKGCSFGNGCSFGEWCRFGEWCIFGNGCSFGDGCSFGEWCRFGEWCSFENGSVKENPRMLKIDRIGSRNGCTYFWKHDDGIYVRCGCFSGDLEQFEEKVRKTHKESPQYLKEYLGAIRYVKDVFE